MKPMTPIKKAGEVAVSRVLVERMEVLLGLRGDPSQHAVRGGGFENANKIGKIAIKRATEAQQTATEALVNYTAIVDDVNAALTAKDAAIEAAQTAANAAITSANTVASDLDAATTSLLANIASEAATRGSADSAISVTVDTVRASLNQVRYSRAFNFNRDQPGVNPAISYIICTPTFFNTSDAKVRDSKVVSMLTTSGQSRAIIQHRLDTDGVAVAAPATFRARAMVRYTGAAVPSLRVQLGHSASFQDTALTYTNGPAVYLSGAAALTEFEVQCELPAGRVLKQFRFDVFNLETDAGTVTVGDLVLDEITEKVGAEALITSEAVARANADSALTATTNTLTTNVGTQTGRIDDIRALKTSSLTGTSLGVFLTQLQVSSGGMSGVVTSQGSAISNLEGTVDALYKIEVKSGTNGALLQLIAPGGGATLAQLEADFINLKGKVSADSLLVGLGGNLLNNTDYKQGLSGWAMARTGGMATNSTDGLRNPTLYYAGSNYPTLFLRQPGSNTATDGFLEWRAVNLTADRVESYQTVPVTPSAWYEISANMATIRGNAKLGGYWYDADGNGLGGFSVSHGSLGVGTGVHNNPDSWPRKATFRQAPSNAAYLMPLFRLDVTDGSAFDKWLFIHKPMVCEATSFSTTPSPYSNGVTTLIDGTGLYSDSITADKIVVGTITAASGIIADAAILEANIGNLQVGTLKIANNAVTIDAYAERLTTLGINAADGWVNVVQIVLSRAAGLPTTFNIAVELRPASNITETNFNIRIARSGTPFRSYASCIIKPNSASPIFTQTFAFPAVDPNTDGGSATYTVQIDPLNAGLFVDYAVVTAEQRKK